MGQNADARERRPDPSHRFDTAASPLLLVRELSVEAPSPAGPRPVLDGVGFALRRGETLCLAGASGSGKSLTALALMRLMPRALRVRSGSIQLDGQELTTLPERAMRGLRGNSIGMVFQEPMTALNPVMTVGAQLVEAMQAHGIAGAEARARAMLEAVQLTEPARRLRQYPHELSGGMRQRVTLAMALSCRPKLLIADEPTTALDATVQQQILALLRELRAEFGIAILLITHDMAVAAEMADRVAVLHEGRLVEEGAAAEVLARPRTPVTRALLEAVPRLGRYRGTDAPPRVTAAPPRPVAPAPVLAVRDLQVTYRAPAGWLGGGQAAPPTVAGVSFAIPAGQTLGLVGESGSGKSTTGRAVLGLLPFEGEVVLDGVPLAGLPRRALRAVRRTAQIIFQDPAASLDPRMRVGRAIAEPLAVHRIGSRAERRDRVAALLRRVHLPEDHAGRYPHELSGGQRQRVCIARALALNPRLIVADESVSALDPGVRARVLDLLAELQEQLGVAYLFISHDMAVIERMSHRVAVMRAGRIIEQGTRREVFEAPQQPYTRALLASVPAGVPAGSAKRPTQP